MITRNDILKSPEYWTTQLQLDLYNCALKFMEENNLNRTQLAKHLGVSKGYVSQLLNGDYDHKLSKLVELSLAFGYVPTLEFQPIEEALLQDSKEYSPVKWKPVRYSPTINIQSVVISNEEEFEIVPNNSNITAA